MGEKTTCPRLYPLQILSRKWSYVVMRTLRQRKRFTELKHELEFITSRILSRELNLLKEECVVEEKEGMYLLTKEGKALLAASEPLMEWSVAHCGLRPCPQQQECSCCANYSEAIKSFKGRTKL